MAQGTTAIRFIVLIGGLVLYVYLYGTFLEEIWNGPAGAEVDLDNQDVQIAGTIGGALGATFAVALGIQRKDPEMNERNLRVGRTITPERPWIGTLCVWVYFIVGAATLYVVWRRDTQTPQEIKAAATVFAGYMVSVFIAAASGPGAASGQQQVDPEA